MKQTENMRALRTTEIVDTIGSVENVVSVVKRLIMAHISTRNKLVTLRPPLPPLKTQSGRTIQPALGTASLVPYASKENSVYVVGEIREYRRNSTSLAKQQYPDSTDFLRLPRRLRCNRRAATHLNIRVLECSLQHEHWSAHRVARGYTKVGTCS